MAGFLTSSRLSATPLVVQQAAKPEEIDDDRESIMPGDQVILIVEDDPHFARVQLDLVRERGFKGGADCRHFFTLHGNLIDRIVRLDTVNQGRAAAQKNAD